MARTIPAAVQTILDSDLAELTTILEVFWGGSTSGASEMYANREISGTGVRAKILNSSEVDEAVQVTGGGQAASFNVVLDDTEGDAKAAFDLNDMHKVPVRAWLYVTGTNFTTEKVSIFLGQVNSPVNWTEGTRQFTFSVVNRIEDITVGFSAEEGAFPQLPEDLIGKPWPLCFGTTINVPALRAVPAVSGTIARGVGIRDFTLQTRLTLAEAITCPQTPIGFVCHTVGGGVSYNAVCNIAFETDVNCLQAKCVEEEKLKLQIAEQISYEFSTLRVFGGKSFPQGRRITLNINGGLFTGTFAGTPTNPSNVFNITSRRHPDYDPTTGTVLLDDHEAAIESTCPGRTKDAGDSNFTDTATGPVFTGLRSSRISWEAYREAKASGFFWADGGATVTLQDRQEIIYIANIVPSTILRVAAFRNINGNRFLLTVPSQFYTIRQVDYNGFDVMEVVFTRPLSNEQLANGGGWTDDIFITQVSTVGPNTVDIIEWFIDTYTSYSKDTASFASVNSAIDNYPMHFPLLDRPNLITILQELAQKARCALWMKDDTFFIKYLAETPTPVDTITTTDILADDSTQLGTLEVGLSKTEDLVTELTSNWRKDHRNDIDDYVLILRHNVSEDGTPKYGTHKKKEDYFPYAHLDLVRKSSTFWLIRWANTWKKLKLSVSLEFLKLEPFDAVTVTLTAVATDPFLAIVERAVVDPESKQINLELWTPIIAGTMAPHDFAFPAAISENAIFPTIDDINRGHAGSGNEPNFSVIAPPGHPLQVTTDDVYQNINLGCNGKGVVSLAPGECRQDHGDGNPSDKGDKKPTVDVASDTATGKISTGSTPISNGCGCGGNSQWSSQRSGKDWDKKNEGDAGRGRETGAMLDNDTGTTGNTTTQKVDRDFLDTLPDPDDVVGPCQVRVFVVGFKTIQYGSKPFTVPGPNGVWSEIYVFDQTAAAVSFCNGLKGASNCGHSLPPGQCLNCTIETGCDPADEGAGNIIGFRTDGPAGRSFADGDS